jgi:alcohol dehydrogenase class IV
MLVCDLKIPGLASLGCRNSDLEGICAKAREASSFKANPVALEDSEIREILQRAL